MTAVSPDVKLSCELSKDLEQSCRSTSLGYSTPILTAFMSHLLEGSSFSSTSGSPAQRTSTSSSAQHCPMPLQNAFTHMMLSCSHSMHLLLQGKAYAEASTDGACIVLCNAPSDEAVACALPTICSS